VLAFPNETGHWAPHEPPLKLFRKSGNPFHDHRSATNSGVVLDVSQPYTVEERQIRMDDEIGIGLCDRSKSFDFLRIRSSIRQKR
jgi:hypothetical protein